VNSIGFKLWNITTNPFTLSIAFYSKNQIKVENTLVSFSNHVINYHYIKIPETKFASGYKLLI